MNAILPPSGDHAGCAAIDETVAGQGSCFKSVPSRFIVKMYVSKFAGRQQRPSNTILPFLPGKVAWADSEISRVAATAAATKPASLRIELLPWSDGTTVQSLRGAVKRRL